MAITAEKYVNIGSKGTNPTSCSRRPVGIQYPVVYTAPTDRIGCQATVVLAVKTTRESLAGDWNAVGILERTRSDHDNVNDVPDSTSTQGDEF